MKLFIRGQLLIVKFWRELKELVDTNIKLTIVGIFSMVNSVIELKEFKTEAELKNCARMAP